LTEAAAKLGIAIIAPDLNGPDDIAGAIQVLASERVDAAVVLETAMLLSVRDQIAKLMSENLVPAMYGYREHVRGLISYGVDLWYGAGSEPRRSRRKFLTEPRLPTCPSSFRPRYSWRST